MMYNFNTIKLTSNVFVVLFITIFLGIGVSANNPIVSTNFGNIRGVELANGATHGFFGIPFAEPPVGSLRYKKPVPFTGSFSNVYNATEFKPPCVQTTWGGPPTSEDCLYLNVYVPSSAGPSDSLPVMVYIHGGRYWTGWSWETDGEYLAAQANAVVVTIAYRLNTFGFFATQSLLDSGDTNIGIRDQQTALQWVQDNIADFQGNPSKVTIFGESAGAGSVLMHLLAPSSANLFNNAILQSTWQFALPTGADGRQASKDLAASVGCPTSPDSALIDCMRNVDAQSLTLPSDDLDYFQPQVDGDLLTDIPLELLRKGQFNKDKPIMIGNTAEEGNFMAFSRNGFTPPSQGMTDETYYAETEAAISPFLSPLETQIMQNLYEGYRLQNSNYEAAAKFFGEFYLYCGGYEAAHWLALYSSKSVYAFIFDHLSANDPEAFLGAAHGNDLAYTFNSTVYPPSYEFTSLDLQLTTRMMTAWGEFAANDSPVTSAADTDQWNEYNLLNPKAFVLEQPNNNRHEFYGFNGMCFAWSHKYR